MLNNMDQIFIIEEKQKNCFSPGISFVFVEAPRFHERAEYFRNVERPKWRRQKRTNGNNGGKK